MVFDYLFCDGQSHSGTTIFSFAVQPGEHDHYLPGMTGSEFLKDLKGISKYKYVPVIVLATTKTDKAIKRSEELGAVDYLIKPVDYNDYVRVAAKMKERAGL